jgi:hypothetical protein
MKKPLCQLLSGIMSILKKSTLAARPHVASLKISLSTGGSKAGRWRVEGLAPLGSVEGGIR